MKFLLVLFSALLIFGCLGIGESKPTTTQQPTTIPTTTTQQNVTSTTIQTTTTLAATTTTPTTTTIATTTTLPAAPNCTVQATPNFARGPYTSHILVSFVNVQDGTSASLNCGNGQSSSYNITGGVAGVNCNYAAVSSQTQQTVTASGGGASCSATVTVDISPAPVIFGVSSSAVTPFNATINWNTDVNTTSIVEYGITLSYGTNSSNSTLITNHSITLGGLLPNNIYHYRVWSANANGLASFSNDYSFQTTPFTETITISANYTTGNTSTSGTDYSWIQWSFANATNATLYWGLNTTSYTSPQSPYVITAFNTYQNYNLTTLVNATTYHYLIMACDRYNNCANTTDATFTTP